MGYDFLADHGDESLNTQGWPWCFDFAVQHGWQPAGTSAADGEYFTNSFQKVTDADAYALGEALLRGLAIEEARERANPTEWPNDTIRRFRKFADFCLKGGFVIG